MNWKNIISTKLVLILVTCSFSSMKLLRAQSPSFEVAVVQEQNLQNLPSASGIAKRANLFYVVGDDSPYLFELNQDFELVRKIEIADTDKLQGHRLPKSHKPDFEAITIVPWGKDNDLLIFGSGGSKNRKTLVRVDFDENEARTKTYPLDKFYKHLQEQSNSNEKLNIEGAAYWNDQLVLLNRSDNTLFMLDLKAFKEFVKDDKSKPKLTVIPFTLPTVNGVPARFSGATILEEEELLVFTASVENEPNWMMNENIVGSYLGIIDLNQLNHQQPVCKPLQKDGKAFKGKLESVHVMDKTDKLIKLIGVTDNDDGSSQVIKIEFRKR